MVLAIGFWFGFFFNLFFEFLRHCSILNFRSPYLIFSCNDRNREENKLQSIQSVSQMRSSYSLESYESQDFLDWHVGKTTVSAIYHSWSIVAYKWTGISKYHNWSLGTLYRRFEVSVLWLDVAPCFLLHRHGRHSSLPACVSLLPGQIRSTHLWAFCPSGSCSMLLLKFLLAGLKMYVLRHKRKSGTSES